MNATTTQTSEYSRKADANRRAAVVNGTVTREIRHLPISPELGAKSGAEYVVFVVTSAS